MKTLLRQRVLLAAFGIFLISVSAPALAELTPGQKLAAEALIKQFESRQFAKRQKAVDDLVKMGPEVLPLIRHHSPCCFP